MADVLKKFGRYILLDQIAQGGMAEIYRARLAAKDGAGRLMVIKRIQAGYGANAEFLQMFKSEIKVTMGFNHPNIVQLYDFGEEANQPFIAMELVDGKNLRQFIQRFSERKQTFTPELAAHIIEQAACGLHYAHTYKDKITGEPLDIIHRDISPQNILISYDGNVKVIDFGIAKATTNSEATRAGVIKGKPSYLSPEQISGEPLDGRSDVFALGIVFWELLTGKKLFAGESDLAVLKLIEACTTHVKPPSTVNTKIPKDLDDIVMKSLTKQRDKRYQTAEELQRAIHKFLQTCKDYDPSDLGYHAKELFKDEIVEDRKKIQRLYDRVEQMIDASDLIDFAHKKGEGRDGKPEADSTTTVVEAREKSTGSREIWDESVNTDVEIEGQKTDSKLMAIQRATNRLGPAAKPAAVGVVGNKAALQRSSGATSGTPSPMRSPRPVSAPQTTSAAKAGLGVVAAMLVLGVFGPELGIRVPIVTDVVEMVTGGPARNPATTTPAPKTTTVAVAPVNPGLTIQPGKTILLKLNITPSGAGSQATINGTALNMNAPALPVKLDAPIEVSVEKFGFRLLKREFVISAAEAQGKTEWVMDVPLEAVRFGYVTIHTTPSADAVINTEGKPWLKKTPLENEKLPVGTYNIKLVNEVLGMEKTVTVSVKENKVVTVDERLEIKN